MKRLAPLAALLCLAGTAHAEIRELATRVADAYRAAGARVTVLPTRFVFEDETIVVQLPPSADGHATKCTSVALVAARGLSFHVGESEDAHSVGSALETGTCEGSLTRLRVRSDAGRGAIEIVVAHSDGRLPPLRAILPERVGGALPPNVDPGPVPALPTPEKRADASESSSRRDGAEVLPRAMAVANESGNGVVHVRIEKGCHRIELFSPESFAGRRKTRLDLDAELHDESGEVLLTRDRGEAADARLEICLADAQDTLLGFGGALPTAPVIITRSTWPIPATVPTMWGSEAIQRLAAALRARHVTPPHAAVLLRQGVVGSTSFIVEAEPGACYVAVVAAARGTSRGVVVRAVVGAAEHADERGINDNAAITSFCTGDRDRVRLTVEARGSALAWGLALYHVTSGAWGTSP